MSDTITHHDARALALIDRALEEGRFSAESVTQISQALQAAIRADAADQRSVAAS
jgi:predicted HD phosphohydrolase